MTRGYEHTFWFVYILYIYVFVCILVAGFFFSFPSKHKSIKSSNILHNVFSCIQQREKKNLKTNKHKPNQKKKGNLSHTSSSYIYKFTSTTSTYDGIVNLYSSNRVYCYIKIKTTYPYHKFPKL